MRVLSVLWILFSFVSGKVVELNDESFESTLNTESGLWLLYFYAPWCHHCKRFSPVLDEIDVSFQSNLSIGKIDATQAKETAAAHEIVTFPTIKFFRNGKYGVYSGDRKYEDLRLFISRIHDVGVTTITDELQLQMKLQEIQFAYVLSIDPTIKDSHALHNLFLELAETHKMHSNFLIYERAGPLLLQKLEINRYPFSFQIPTDSFSVESKAIEQWIEHHNHLLISPLDKSNMRRLGRTGKPLFIALIEENQTASLELLSHLETAVSLLDIHDAHQVIFGHMDGVRYHHYLERYSGATTLPALLIIDLSVNGYYVLKKKEITLESVKEVIGNGMKKQLSYHEVEPVDGGILEKIQRRFKKYYPWSLLSFLPFVFLLLSFLFPHPNSLKEKAA